MGRTPRTSFPSEELRDRLLGELGLARDDHEARRLRTLLYQAGVPLPEGASADEVARALLAVGSTGKPD